MIRVRVAAIEVETIEAGLVTDSVPPSTLIGFSTVAFSIFVVVLIHC